MMLVTAAFIEGIKSLFSAAEVKRLQRELETERMRLVACGVISMSNTPESAAYARTMHDDYWCASVSDVARAVDREMILRNRVAALERMLQPLPKAAMDVFEERRRHVQSEGWTAEHDDERDSGEMAGAASAYALAAADKMHPMSQGDGEFDKLPPAMWPWDYEWWKPGEPRRMLVKAGALILAEIERIDRAKAAGG